LKYVYDVLIFFTGLGLLGGGVWLLVKDMYRASFLLIGFGFMGVGISFWPPAALLGVFILSSVVLLTRWEALGHLKRRE
jgi:hypothetical protein